MERIMTKTGKVILQGKNISITEALPSAKIFKSGFVVGGHYSMKSLENSAKKTSSNDK